MNESPTRRKLIMLIKKGRGTTVDELSGQLGITPMGVRQHLIALEKRGIVKFTPFRHGIGRPKFQYRLTEKATDAFPHAYNKLATDILRFIKEVDGKVKVEELFKKRKENILAEKEKLLPERTKLSARVSAMADILNKDGYMVEVEETDKTFKLKKFHCPISEIAHEFKDPCHYELELYKDIFNKGVQREHCQTDGHHSCTYVIPKVTAISLK